MARPSGPAPTPRTRGGLNRAAGVLAVVVFCYAHVVFYWMRSFHSRFVWSDAAVDVDLLFVLLDLRARLRLVVARKALMCWTFEWNWFPRRGGRAPLDPVTAGCWRRVPRADLGGTVSRTCLPFTKSSRSLSGRERHKPERSPQGFEIRS